MLGEWRQATDRNDAKNSRQMLKQFTDTPDCHLASHCYLAILQPVTKTGAYERTLSSNRNYLNEHLRFHLRTQCRLDGAHGRKLVDWARLRVDHDAVLEDEASAGIGGDAFAGKNDAD